MRFDVLTIFPELFPGPLGAGVVGRALAAQRLELNVHDLRDYTSNAHRQVDDVQFGGGAGMVLKPEPIVAAVRALRAETEGLRTILLSPQGRRFSQAVARELAAERAVLLVCGRYQGVDQRAVEEIGEAISLGDFVLSGGEVAAMAVIEATARMLPGVVGDPDSLEGETFSDDREVAAEAPLYTRPADFEGKVVPEVLRSGNHAAIAAWRRQQSHAVVKRLGSNLVRFPESSGGSQ